MKTHMVSLISSYCCSPLSPSLNDHLSADVKLVKSYWRSLEVENRQRNSWTKEDPFGLYLRAMNRVHTIHGLRPNTKLTMYMVVTIRSFRRSLKLLTAYRIFYFQRPQVQSQTATQPITITDEEVDKIAHEFTAL